MPSKGDLLIDGESADPKKHNLAFVFQEPSSIPWKTVEENLRFGLELKKLPKKEIDERVENIIKLMGLQNFRDAYPHQLSVSTEQRIIIGRHFVVDSVVIPRVHPQVIKAINMSVEPISSRRSLNGAIFSGITFKR